MAVGVLEYQSEERYQRLARDLSEAFIRTDLTEVIRILDRGFDGVTYSLKSLFRDEQYRTLELILRSELAGVEAAYGQIYDDRSSLMHYITGLDVPLPPPFHKAAEFTLNARLRRLFDATDLDFERTTVLLNEARALNVPLDSKSLEYAFRQNIEAKAEQWAAAPYDVECLSRLEAMAEMLSSLPFQVNLWKVQNLCFEIQQGHDSRRSTPGQDPSEMWTKQFHALAERLGVRVLKSTDRSEATRIP